jgi:hypothetical protein
MDAAVIQINFLLADTRAVKWRKPPANPVLNDLAIVHFRVSISRGINFAVSQDLTPSLLVVDDSTNQAKSDQAPHEWLPPQKSYWCEYGKRWERVKDKYGLRYSDQERIALNSLAETCL